MSWRKSTGLWIIATIVAMQCLGGSSLLAQDENQSTPTSATDEVELRFADYEARLNAILKTRRLEEQQFVNQVLQKVRSGDIPVPLMESSFVWVLKNRPETPYPFIYFERVLRLQAGLVEIEIPEFDYGVYNERVQHRRTN